MDKLTDADRTAFQNNLSELAALLEDVLAISPELDPQELVAFLRTAASSRVAVDVFVAALATSKAPQKVAEPAPAARRFRG